MRQILYILILAIATSCVAKKEIVFISTSEVEKKDSTYVKEEKEVRDTTLSVLLKKDSAKAETKIIYSHDSAYFEPIYAKGKYGSAKAYSDNGVAKLDYYEGGVSIEATLRGAVVEIRYWKEKYEKESEKKSEVIKETVTVTKNSRFANFAVAFFWAVLAILVVGGIFLSLFVRLRKNNSK